MLLNPDKVYKIYQVNGSFNESIKLLFDNIIYNEYDITDIKKSQNTINPDGVKVGSALSSFHKPEYLYTYIFIESSSTHLGGGFGHEYYKCKLSNNKNLYVYWDTAISKRTYSKNGLTIFNNKTIRKIKLDKVNETR